MSETYGPIDVSGEETGEFQCADIRVDGNPVASVSMKDGEINITVYDPERPHDSHAEYEFDRPDETPEDRAGRAEVEAERKLDRRRERHFDENGHF